MGRTGMCAGVDMMSNKTLLKLIACALFGWLCAGVVYFCGEDEISDGESWDATPFIIDIDPTPAPSFVMEYEGMCFSCKLDYCKKKYGPNSRWIE